MAPWVNQPVGFGMDKLMNALLATVLLAAQLLVFEHQLDLDLHQGSESCQVCMLASPLGHAVAVVPMVVSVAPVFALTLPTALPLSHPQRSTVAYSVRAPPALPRSV